MTPEVLAALKPNEVTVTRRVLAEEDAKRKHLLVSLSGAHAYGFPSPDSDLDLKAVHFDPSAELLGFPRAPAKAERLEIIDGVEIDFSSNEIGHVLASVLKGNGNFIERFLSRYLVAQSDELAAALLLVQRSLSKRIARHYLGFATQQRAEWEATGRTSVKRLLYVLRTSLTGVHGLSEGRIETDVSQLLERYGFADARELIVLKQTAEKSELPPATAARWAERVPRAFELLEHAEKTSALPMESPNAAEIERWLITQRLALLER